MPAHRTALHPWRTAALGTAAVAALLLVVRLAAHLAFDDLAQRAAAVFATACCAGKGAVRASGTGWGAPAPR